MAYVAPVQRIAYCGGVRLGTELISITPGAARLGGEVGTDIDQLSAYISVMSPNMKYTWTVLSYLRGANVGVATPQLELHTAFLREIRFVNAKGLELNDLVWIDDVSKTTKTDLVATLYGPLTDQVIDIDDLSALDVSAEDYVWIGAEASGYGFAPQVKATGVNTITIDIPAAVTLGGITQELRRKIANNNVIYKADFVYPRCRYSGQTMPSISENSQDDHRFNMSYMFESDTQPLYSGVT